MCAPHFPPFELQSRPRCSAVVPLFLTPSPFTLSPSSSLKLLSLPSSSVHFGVVVASFLVRRCTRSPSSVPHRSSLSRRSSQAQYSMALPYLDGTARGF